MFYNTSNNGLCISTVAFGSDLKLSVKYSTSVRFAFDCTRPYENTTDEQKVETIFTHMITSQLDNNFHDTVQFFIKQNKRTEIN